MLMQGCFAREVLPHRITAFVKRFIIFSPEEESSGPYQRGPIDTIERRWTTWLCRHLSVTPGGRVAILFLEVARRSPWCRGTPAHVHWSLLRCPPDGGGGGVGGGNGGGGGGGDGFSPLRFVSPKRRGERRRTPLPRPTGSPLPSPYTTDSPPRVHDFPHLGGPRPPSLLYPPHPLAVVAAAKRSPSPSLLPPPHRPLPTRPLPSSSPPALFHLQRGDDPTHPTVARYYHSVLLAIYRPLSTTLPPNGVYRCCLAA